ncbi:sensor histidine kinase [Nocardia brasiliensis]|uniref:sensor histidine kinase n=1 Tax=Nocardia brasiliensis TaxID=37326 RepID=UPI003D8B61E4
MRRGLLLLCLVPAVVAVLLELLATGSLVQVLLDLTGVVAGSFACGATDRTVADADPRARVALAVPVLAVVVVACWSSSPAAWAVGSTWVLIVGAGVTVARAGRALDYAVAGVLAVAAVAAVLPMAAGSGDLLTVVALLTIPTIIALGAGLVYRVDQRRLAAERAAALASERAAIARELHDLIAHEVTGMVVLAQATRPLSTGAAQGALYRIEEAGRRALADIRGMVGTLRRGSVGADTELVPADAPGLTEMTARFRATSNAEVIAEVARAVRPPRVSDEVMLAIHRILLEALTNIRRHAADATRVEIRLTLTTADEVRLSVSDNGTGASGLGEGSGYGLLGLAERAAAVGGTLTSGRGPDGRWTVRAYLPAAGTASAKGVASS